MSLSFSDCTTLADILSRAEPNNPAVLLPEDGSTTTYRDLADQVESLAASLRASFVNPGEALAIVLPNGLEYLASFLAVTRARCIAAPLNPAYKADEYRFYLEDAGVRAILAPPEAHPVNDVARQLGLPVWRVSRDQRGRVRWEGEGLGQTAAREGELPAPTDVALFLHTSGTTSR